MLYPSAHTLYKQASWLCAHTVLSSLASGGLFIIFAYTLIGLLIKHHVSGASLGELRLSCQKYHLYHNKNITYSNPWSEDVVNRTGLCVVTVGVRGHLHAFAHCTLS